MSDGAEVSLRGPMKSEERFLTSFEMTGKGDTKKKRRPTSLEMTGGVFAGNRLPASADTVAQDRGAVLVDGDLELSGESGGFGVLEGGVKHFPVAADGLVDFDGDGRILVVAQSNFKFHFPSVRVNALVVCLLALGDNVESVADMDDYVFVFGSVVDAVFADEEDAAA